MNKNHQLSHFTRISIIKNKRLRDEVQEKFETLRDLKACSHSFTNLKSFLATRTVSIDRKNKTISFKYNARISKKPYNKIY